MTSAPNTAPPTHADYQLSQLDQLEAESIHIFREVAAEFEKPVLMFSGGKDSIVMLRLAEKAFFPAKIPFPLVQIELPPDDRDRAVGHGLGADPALVVDHEPEGTVTGADGELTHV